MSYKKRKENKMEITVESLGLTKKAVEKKVIECAVEKLLLHSTYDEDGDKCTVTTRLQEKMKTLIKERIDETINIFAEENVLPKVVEYIENITLQATNEWGEKKGEPLTFIEYLLQRAEYYMFEEVDSKGESERENGGYSWKGTQTRVSHLIHQHLHYSIETAMKRAMADANSFIIGGLEEAVKIKLKEVQEKISVGIKNMK